MIKYAGLLSFSMFVAGLAFVVWYWRGGVHMTFSQHVARHRIASIYYSVLFIVSLPFLYLFFNQWFVPTFHMPEWFMVFVIISTVFQIACTFIPETGGWKTTIHRILTGISGVSLLPLVGLIVLSPTIALIGRWVAALCLIGMTALLLIALKNQKGHRHALFLQIGYYALFFLAVLYVTYF